MTRSASSPITVMVVLAMIAFLGFLAALVYAKSKSGAPPSYFSPGHVVFVPSLNLNGKVVEVIKGSTSRVYIVRIDYGAGVVTRYQDLHLLDGDLREATP